MEGRTYTVIAGHLQDEMTLRKIDHTCDSLFLKPSLFKSLMIPSKINVNMWLINETIYLGPVVGIFVNKKCLSEIANQVPPRQIENEIEANAFTDCLNYYFSIDGIHWPTKTIQGYTFVEKQKRWICRLFPFPNVIYDCGKNFTLEQMPTVSFIRQQFANNPNTSFINEKDSIGNWKLYEHLNKYEGIAEALPEMVPFVCADQLWEMLAQYRIVYLKSFDGSDEQGLLSIERGENSFILDRYHDHKITHFPIRTFDKLIEQINRLIGEEDFIIQEGVDLLTYKGSSLDLRILMIKDQIGSWKVIYTLANLAEELTTFTTVGGSIRNYQDIYQELNKIISLPTEEEIKEKALMFAQSFENEFGYFGELELTLAIDKQGKIWFINVDTKPVRVASVFEYAVYLAKIAAFARSLHLDHQTNSPSIKQALLIIEQHHC